ncbi:plasmid transfer protein, partial [Streptomyces termitum]
MTDVATLWEVGLPLATTAGGLGYAKVRAPRVFWSLVGLPVTRVRFAVTYHAT